MPPKKRKFFVDFRAKKPERKPLRRVNELALHESPFLRYGRAENDFFVTMNVLDSSRVKKTVFVHCSLAFFPRFTCPEELRIKSMVFEGGKKVQQKYFLALRAEISKVFLGAMPAVLYLP